MNTVSVTGSVSRKAGGLFESVRRLHQSLAEIPDVHVTVLGLRDEFTDEDLPFWQPVPVRVFNIVGPNRFGFSPQLRDYLLGMDSDIVHTHAIWMYISVAVTKLYRRRKIPYLISAHGMLDRWAIGNSFWKKRLAHSSYEGAHLRGAACLRALCQPEADAIRACGLKNPVCVIPNGTDLPSLSDSELSLLEGPLKQIKDNGQRILLYLGRLHPKKGLSNLLRAWHTVQEQTSRGGWVLAIAGWDEGGHENELVRLAKDLGIHFADVRVKVSPNSGRPAESPSLYFLGPQFRECKMSSYHQCDAFVLPSLSEGFPMVVLEAWAYAKPVLMTPECNLAEGFASDAAIKITTSIEGIASGLNTLFDMSAENRRAMGSRGQEAVIRSYSWKRIAGEMKGVYDWVLGGGSRPECVSL
ncbi:MAG: glycosyltransferase [Chthoniobacterales bacterium]|nr:glycosyltransferase [Chthoniobacterales bacterium]